MMVPKIAKRGASFKGAAAYYLHDKEATTRHRVAFNHTWNLPTEEPDLAWRYMAYTAKHATVLKDEAGVAATGRKLQKPVYTVSLAWAPDEKPDTAEMVRAAESALKALGLQKCQTLLIAHNDEPHPHVHLMVNLVDPDTGKVRDPGLDKRKLSRWAEAYEKEQGVVRCEQRIENNAQRDLGEKVRDDKSYTRQDIQQRERIEREIIAERKKALWQRQVADREALKRLAEERAKAIRTALKEKYKPEWAAFYKKQRQDRRDTDNARRSILAAMRVAIKERRRLTPDGRPGIGTVIAYMVDARALGEVLRAAEDRELFALKQRMNDDRHAMVRAVWAGYGDDFRKLKDEQAAARRDPPPLDPALEEKRRQELAQSMPLPQPPATRENRRGRDYSQITPTPGQTEPGKGAPVSLGRDKEALDAAHAQIRAEAEEIERRREERRRRERGGRTAPPPPVAATPPAPPATAKPDMSDDERRRESLREEFRREAEEIARRREERRRQQKDRDRDRER